MSFMTESLKTLHLGLLKHSRPLEQLIRLGLCFTPTTENDSESELRAGALFSLCDVISIYREHFTLEQHTEIAKLPSFAQNLWEVSNLSLKIIRCTQLLIEIESKRRFSEKRAANTLIQIECLKLGIKILMTNLTPYGIFCEENSIRTAYPSSNLSNSSPAADNQTNENINNNGNNSTLNGRVAPSIEEAPVQVGRRTGRPMPVILRPPVISPSEDETSLPSSMGTLSEISSPLHSSTSRQFQSSPESADEAEMDKKASIEDKQSPLIAHVLVPSASSLLLVSRTNANLMPPPVQLTIVSLPPAATQSMIEQVKERGKLTLEQVKAMGRRLIQFFNDIFKFFRIWRVVRSRVSWQRSGGEWLWQVRTLIYALMLRRYGRKSWLPWLALLVTECIALIILKNDTVKRTVLAGLTQSVQNVAENNENDASTVHGQTKRHLAPSMAELTELSERQGLLIWSMMRSPMFEKILEKPLKFVDNFIQKIPIINLLTTIDVRLALQPYFYSTITS